MGLYPSFLVLPFFKSSARLQPRLQLAAKGEAEASHYVNQADKKVKFFGPTFFSKKVG